ncbi:sugar ABC transporter ATP-binding protein [Sedimentitalea sp. CY04]|uniref:Sugar ABC transporter ATP-binding protein n=1 Tax=Parasedimentitalea denitrificans TaxID=2211118 RepID=A0ABX0W5U1_9RHOB|nr:ABC transporter ATP-binding protein [Sedimentitalea sp. CY04]NIZ60012.1 sugar ABC transporter ATP-binding protein [Sedimentitalea sp. CY04]
MSESNTPLMQVKDLRVEYLTAGDPFAAVRDVSFDIHRNEVLGLAGESGCGKSTIAYSLMRLHKPPALIRSGDIRFEGRSVLAFDAERLRAWRWSEVSMVFQSAMNSLNPVMSILGQFSDMLKAHGKISREDIITRTAEMLKMVGIPAERMHAYPHQLSGGMRQRVALALALTLRPKLIVMDEPTTALDVVVQREILQEVLRLREELGFSVLFITHDLALMAQISDRIGIMKGGEIIEIGSAEQIVTNPQHEYTQALWSAMPVLEQVEESDAHAG